MQVIVTGSLAFDQIMDFPGKFSDHILPEKIHQINLSFLVNKLVKHNGGTAGNIAYNLALLSLKPTILATAGNDFADYKKSLEDVGVNTSMIYIIEAEPTASAFIFTDKSDNQITGFYPGAMGYSGELSIKKIDAEVRSEKWEAGNRSEKPEVGISLQKISFHYPASHVQLPTSDKIFVVISPNDPLAMMNFVRECQELNLNYMFDPGMQLPRLSDKDLKMGIEGAKIVIGNDYEMALIRKRIFPRHPEFISGSVSDKKRMLKTLNIFQGQHDEENNQIWITTMGEKGARIEAGDTIYSIPPSQPKQVLDPTGAGDAWRAGFLAGYLSGQPLDVCGRIGSVAAVYTVEKYGTQTHKFTKKEFAKRYYENFKQEMRNEKWEAGNRNKQSFSANEK